MKIKERNNDSLKKKKSLKNATKGKIVKNKKLAKNLVNSAKTGKDPLVVLQEILRCDHIITFNYEKVKKRMRLICSEKKRSKS
jgi:hypothetical protein